MEWEHEEVGARLRVERERIGLSVRELARRLHVSPSLISQIETGRTRPSVRTLYAIVSELDLSLDELFGAAPPDGPAPQAAPPPEVLDALSRLVQRGGARNVIELECGVRWERLTAAPDPNVDFLYVVYEVGGASSPGDALMLHGGREYGIVIRGRLSVTVAFDTVVLGPGDSIFFDSTTPHLLRNDGDEPVHAIWFVIGRHGDARQLLMAEEEPGHVGVARAPRPS